MIKELKRHPAGGFVHPCDPGERGYEGNPPRISVTAEEAKMLSALAAGLTVFEIGTGLGVATRAMAETAVTVYTVDVDEWVMENIAPTLPENVIVLDALYKIPVVDMVFIDGLHTMTSVSEDIRLARRCMPSFIVFHDTKMLAVQKAIKAAGLDVFNIETAFGLGVARL